MGGLADTDSAGATGEERRQARLSRKDQGQRAGPEGCHELVQNRRYLGGQFRHLDLLGDQHQHRLVRLPLFNGEKPRKGLDIEGINAETVIGFRGKGDQAPLTKQMSCLSKGRRI